jgi:hypothetical protein
LHVQAHQPYFKVLAQEALTLFDRPVDAGFDGGDLDFEGRGDCGEEVEELADYITLASPTDGTITIHTEFGSLRSCEAGEYISGLLNEGCEVLWSLVISVEFT